MHMADFTSLLSTHQLYHSTGEKRQKSFIKKYDSKECITFYGNRIVLNIYL